MHVFHQAEQSLFYCILFYFILVVVKKGIPHKKMDSSVAPPRFLPVRNWTFHHPADYVIVILLIVFSALLSTLGKPHCRTFEWTDTTINFPPHPDSFPVYSLVLMGVFSAVLFALFNLFVIRVLRCCIPAYGRCFPVVYPCQRSSYSLNASSEWPSFTHNRTWNVTSGPLFSWLMALVYALTMQFFCVSVLKLYVGRPRPDFLSRLAAHGYTSKTTLDPLSGKSLPDPHTDPDFFCDLGYKIKSNPSLIDGRLSFPSGHSSISFAICTVAAFFLFSHLRPFAYRGSFLRLCIAFSPFWVSLFCATSRTRDNKHHYADALAGSIIGFVSGLLAVSLCFRVTGGPAMVVLERADDDIEYVKMEQMTSPSGVSSPNAAFEGAPTTSYMGTTLMNNEKKERLGKGFSTPKPQEGGQSLMNKDLSFHKHTVLLRNGEDESRVDLSTIPLADGRRIGWTSSGCLVVVEQELNESKHAVPWI